MTLRQVKTGKHECRNVIGTLLLHFGTRSYLFSPDERSCYVFSTQNNCFYSIIKKARFLHFMVLFSKVFTKPLLPRVCRAIVVKSSLGHCRQEFIGPLSPRVRRAIVAKSSSGHCRQEFVGPLSPRVRRAIVAKSPSGHCCQELVGPLLANG